MLRDIREKIAGGMPCMAECGGFMYLHEQLVEDDGTVRRLCGVIPGSVKNTGRLSRFGYITLTPSEEGMMAGDISVKGHEFHYWDSDDPGSDWTAEKTSGKSYGCIHDTGTLVAGFPHLYYYSQPEVPYRFLKAAEKYSAD